MILTMRALNGEGEKTEDIAGTEGPPETFYNPEVIFTNDDFDERRLVCKQCARYDANA